MFGGRLLPNLKKTNKVSTFDKSTHSWISFYPDMMSVRSRPGVVTHLEYVIVAGGTVNDDACVRDIEILNWVENYAWRIVPLHLPFPMYALTPTISNDDLYIVGFSNNEGSFRNAYAIPAASIATPFKENISKSWQKLTSCTSYGTALIPGLSSPVVIGGHTQVDQTHKVSTADICMYDTATKSWKQVGKLSFPRSNPAVVNIGNNAIVVIGGTVYRNNMTGPQCLPTVELGQVALINDTAV